LIPAGDFIQILSGTEAEKRKTDKALFIILLSVLKNILPIGYFKIS